MTTQRSNQAAQTAEPTSADADEQLSYDQRAAAATEAVRQLTAYFQKRE